MGKMEPPQPKLKETTKNYKNGNSNKYQRLQKCQQELQSANKKYKKYKNGNYNKYQRLQKCQQKLQSDNKSNKKWQQPKTKTEKYWVHG